MSGKTVFSMGVLLCLMLLASDAAAGDATGQVVKLWPGHVPDEVRNMGAEKVVMSPALDRKQVEVTESTRSESAWSASPRAVILRWRLARVVARQAACLHLVGSIPRQPRAPGTEYVLVRDARSAT